MVNTGQPSKGCFLCRKRRVKCDERKPGCRNCERLKRQCPGYRAAFDTIPRHEGDHALLNAPGPHVLAGISARGPFLGDLKPGLDITHPTDAAALRSRSRLQEAISDKRAGYAFSRKESSIYQPVSSSIEQRALCYFLSNFVLMPKDGAKCGFMTFVIPLLNLDTTGTMASAIEAASLAAFACRPASRSVVPRAEASYAKALRRVTYAIGHPTLALQDVTLAAVLILGVFESVARCNSSERRTQKANFHIQGAATLMKLRAGKALPSDLTYSMGIMAKAQMLSYAFILGQRPIDDAAYELTGFGGTIGQMDTQSAILRCDVNDIVATGDRGPESRQKMLRLMKQAQDCELQYAVFMEHLPLEWRFRTIGWKKVAFEDLQTSPFCTGRVDSYLDKWAVNMLNVLRASRLFLAHQLVRITAWLHANSDYKEFPEYKHAAKLGKESADEIVASLPTVLGDVPDEDASRPKPYGFPCGDDDDTAGKGLSGLSMLWPMYAVMTSDFASAEQREWMAGRMKHVAENVGVSKAIVYAQDYGQLTPSSEIEAANKMLLSNKDENTALPTQISAVSPQSVGLYSMRPMGPVGEADQQPSLQFPGQVAPSDHVSQFMCFPDYPSGCGPSQDISSLIWFDTSATQPTLKKEHSTSTAASSPAEFVHEPIPSTADYHRFRKTIVDVSL